LFVAVAPLLATETKSKPSPLNWNQTDQSSRSRAIALAGDFSGQGYHVRDGYWSGTVEKGKPVVIAINLFCGNDYWFSAASPNPSARLKVSIFDCQGRPAVSETYQEESRAAASITAARTGRYFVALDMTEGDKSDACMVYSYK
jgi:hypothetical protein